MTGQLNRSAARCCTLALAGALSLAPLAARAEDHERRLTLSTDLDADGAPEVWRILLSGTGAAHVSMTTRGRTVAMPGALWTADVAGTIPYLADRPEGGLAIVMGNEGYGRRWFQTAEIGFLDDAFRVTGFSYDWYDPIDLDAFGGCTVDFVTRRAGLSLGDARWVVALDPGTAPDIATWPVDRFPEVCYPVQ
jgi:hypothetical protein